MDINAERNVSAKRVDLPTLGGEFFLSRRFGYADGIMGGNLWFLGFSEDAAILAAERAAQAADKHPDVITTFPGGVAASASKAGSSYKFLIASTLQNTYCPTLKEKLGERSLVPDGVVSIMEIIINGSTLEQVAAATYASIEAALTVDGIHSISAGNYSVVDWANRLFIFIPTYIPKTWFTIIHE